MTLERIHEVAAFYGNGPEGFYPAIECSCGWGAREPTWEEAGREYDEHLRKSEATSA